MNKSESKYFHTALLMDKALVSLLEVKDFEYITVKEICDKAGVNRSTFYLHYETIADLLEESIERSNKRFLEQFSFVPDGFVSNIENAPLDDLVFINTRYLIPYLTFIKENKSVYRAAFKNPVCMNTEKQLENASRYVLMPIMSRFHIPEKEQPYWIGFTVHGCMAIVREWMNRNCEDSVDDIARIMMECIRPEKQ